MCAQIPAKYYSSDTVRWVGGQRGLPPPQRVARGHWNAWAPRPVACAPAQIGRWGLLVLPPPSSRSPQRWRWRRRKRRPPAALGSQIRPFRCQCVPRPLLAPLAASRAALAGSGHTCHLQWRVSAPPQRRRRTPSAPHPVFLHRRQPHPRPRHAPQQRWAALRRWPGSAPRALAARQRLTPAPRPQRLWRKRGPQRDREVRQHWAWAQGAPLGRCGGAPGGRCCP